jgi:hypothetical protein
MKEAFGILLPDGVSFCGQWLKREETAIVGD